MKVLGISAFAHDASVCLIEDNKILFAAHSERYNKHKNSSELDSELISNALKYGIPDEIAFYEHPWHKKGRQLLAGQFKEVFDMSQIPEFTIGKLFPSLMGIPITYYPHHLSHAAAGALTSEFEEACVVVIDAIGEWDCVTIWKYQEPCTFTKLYSAKYPHSIGLFYTAMTHRVGLKPNEDEYILMGMAAYGKPIYAVEMEELFFKNKLCELRTNLHRGCSGYRPDADDFDIAASAQLVVENKIHDIMQHASEVCDSKNLVYMGGVALNCLANRLLHDHFDNVWLMPNPGDAGSSIGAAALHLGHKVKWDGPYLGYEIPGKYPINAALTELLSNKIVGVANGKAEFGPRALGNRTLFADPRGNDVKDRVNEIKRRQKFRPFAPVIIEELADKYFEMNGLESSPYMQYVVKCREPDKFPAIVHGDGTSRIQTVNKEQHPELYELLERFYAATGCPILLNTSLNIKGQPIVNDEADALAFEGKYGVVTLTKELR